MSDDVPARSASDGVVCPSLALRAGLFALLLSATALMFYRLADRDLWSSHEARAAMDADSVLRGEALPQLHDGRPELQKPPLFYWLVAAIGWLRGGVDELAVRLPATLCAVGVLLVVGVGLGVGFGRPVAGLLAMLILATGIHFPWLARIGRIDVPLTFAVTAAAMAFALARGSRILLALGYTACAVGVLLKGPIGLALPAAIVTALLLAERRWPACWELRAWRDLLGELHVLPGTLLFLFLTVPVFVWLDAITEGQFTRDFLWYHNVQRGLGGAQLRSHPVTHYLGYLFLYLLPWSPLLLLAWPRFWNGDRVARFGLAWLVGVVVLLSAARFKRADYLLPAYPGAAIFLGCCLERLLATRWHRTVLTGIVATSLVMLLGWTYRIAWSLPKEESYRDYRTFAAVVRHHAPAPHPVVFFRAEAHALAFRVGQPLDQIVEWPSLLHRLEQPGPHWIVMPTKVVAEARSELPGVEFVEHRRNTDDRGRHERPLVLLQARLRETHASAPQTAADRPRADKHPPPGR